MLEQTNVKEIQEAVLILREMSADEQMKELARRRELALHDRITDLEVSRQEGRMEGLQKGLEKGKLETINSIAEKMRQKGMSEEEINTLLNI